MVQNKTLSVIIGIGVIGLVGFLVVNGSNKNTIAKNQNVDNGQVETIKNEDVGNINIVSTSSTTEKQNNQTGTSVKTFTMADISAHNTQASCYSIIDNNIYDLTSWISKHPGGEKAITGICGKNGTTVFHGKHDDAKKQADILATFKIGVLAE